MKTLSFLLLLDFSGSMEQQIDEKLKSDILKKETRALISSANENSQSTLIVFGTDPKKQCQDLRVINSNNKELPSQIAKLKPGPFGKTPLSLGLKQMISLSKKNNFQHLIVVTDGADSCDQNPCETLKQQDNEIQKKIKINIIGFDLKDDRQKISCFKDLKLKNIDIQLIEANNINELNNAIKNELDMLLKNENTFANLNQSALNKNIKQSQLSQKSIEGIKNSFPALAEFNPKTDAIVEIQGAESDDNFLISGSLFNKNWFGSFPVIAKAGKYDIQFNHANGISISLDLPAGTYTKIPLAKLMKITQSTIEISDPILGLKLVPSNKTTLIHGEVKETHFEATTNSQTNQKNLAIGEWQVEVESPLWLKSQLKKISIKMNVNKSENINLISFFQDEIQVLENNSMKVRVLELTHSKLNSVERHLILPNQKRIPILKDHKYQWLDP